MRNPSFIFMVNCFRPLSAKLLIETELLVTHTLYILRACGVSVNATGCYYTPVSNDWSNKAYTGDWFWNVPDGYANAPTPFAILDRNVPAMYLRWWIHSSLTMDVGAGLATYTFIESFINGYLMHVNNLRSNNFIYNIFIPIY